jgi:hypothetical protein
LVAWARQFPSALGLADFDLRGSPPVYKAAALPIELRQRPLKGKGTLSDRGSGANLNWKTTSDIGLFRAPDGAHVFDVICQAAQAGDEGAFAALLRPVVASPYRRAEGKFHCH